MKQQVFVVVNVQTGQILHQTNNNLQKDFYIIKNNKKMTHNGTIAFMIRVKIQPIICHLFQVTTTEVI